MLAYLIWNPDRNLFIIPYIHHPITWYGFLFATGFLLGYFIIRRMFAEILMPSFTSKEECELQAIHLTDRLALLIVAGGIIGARLGHVFFYDWPYYSLHPLDILKIWEGGLASHGGAIGALIALLVFTKISIKVAPQFSFLTVLDTIAVPTALIATLIRVGNFINQEITGTPTFLPWGVIFSHPIDGIAGVPLHPVQLYEAFFYFLIFTFLTLIWFNNRQIVGRGVLSGWFFLLVFGFRFFIEFLKMPQNEIVDTHSWLRMGQWLSLPFIFLGLFLLVRTYKYVKKTR